jgi:6-phosphogluconolactonase
MKRIHVARDEETAAWTAAEIISTEVAGGARTVVLAGGSTPRRCYQALAQKPLPWGRVTILFGDERCVPPLDAESNFRMVMDSFLGATAPASVHRIPAELGPDEGSTAYERVVERCLPIDLVLLGMGPDGHCASLFPDHPALDSDRWVVAVRAAPKPPPDRVSLSLRSLRAARRVLFLVTGAAKAQAVLRARRGEVPAGLIPEAEWVLDEGAASLLGRL